MFGPGNVNSIINHIEIHFIQQQNIGESRDEYLKSLNLSKYMYSINNKQFIDETDLTTKYRNFYKKN